MKKTIQVPKAKALSSLGGVSLVALEHDADELLEGYKEGWKAAGLELVSVTPFTFQGRNPGYLVLLYDVKKDELRKLYDINDGDGK